MKTIEQRAKEAYPINDYSIIVGVMIRGAYIRGAKEQQAIDEEVRLKKSDDMTNAEYDREIAFTDWYCINGKSTPTFSDAIEWARKQTIEEMCELVDEFLHSYLMKNHISYKEVEQEFRKLATNWLRNLSFKKEKMLRDKVVEMYGEEAGVYYDKTCQGIPLGSFLKTVMFVHMVEEARELLEAEK